MCQYELYAFVLLCGLYLANASALFPQNISHSLRSVVKINGHANRLQLKYCPFISLKIKH